VLRIGRQAPTNLLPARQPELPPAPAR
jgi:hypothetical protein